MLKHMRGSLLLLTAAIIWGTAFVAQRKGMRYVEPFTYNAIRTLIGGLVLIPVILGVRLLRKKSAAVSPAVSRKATLRGGICCGITLFTASSLQQCGIALTTAGKAGFITALYIVIVPLLSVFLHQKPPKVIWICVAGAVAGFWMLCIRSGFTINRGDLLTLGCALCFAVHIMVVDHFCTQQADCIVLACIQFFTAGSLMTAVMLCFEHPDLQNILAAKGTILYAGMMSSGVEYNFQILGQRETPPTVATLLMCLESVFAALSGWLLLHEHLSAAEFSGCVLVFASVITAQLVVNKTSPKD
ncbi:MAG: DMT family transporter [Oscillospiraceae bacterium]|nr:DMT family transporter [Oscillospiraceae bacterium]